MRWLRWCWRRLWGFHHEPHEVDDGRAAAAARAQQERLLAEARREAARQRPDVRRAADTFTSAVEQALWRRR